MGNYRTATQVNSQRSQQAMLKQQWVYFLKSKFKDAPNKLQMEAFIIRYLNHHDLYDLVQILPETLQGHGVPTDEPEMKLIYKYLMVKDWGS
jgi:hypothetical protein